MNIYVLIIAEAGSLILKLTFQQNNNLSERKLNIRNPGFWCHNIYKMVSCRIKNKRYYGHKIVSYNNLTVSSYLFVLVFICSKFLGIQYLHSSVRCKEYFNCLDLEPFLGLNCDRKSLFRKIKKLYTLHIHVFLFSFPYLFCHIGGFRT